MAVTNAAACAAMTGSDPAAYALINSPRGSTLTSGVTTAPGPLLRIPTLATLNQQKLTQERLGLTGALQWRPTERTLINFDARLFESSSTIPRTSRSRPSA